MTLAASKRDETINSTILVQCTVTGESLDAWFFTRTNTKISDQLSDRVHVVSNGDVHTMKIQNIQQGDGGEYECRAKSGAKATFTLWIHGKHLE